MHNKLAFRYILAFFALFASFITAKYSNAAPQGDGTEIVVLGTVHEPTARYNPDTLVNILNRISPDVVLVECDTSYMTPDFNFKEHIKDIALETRALTMYKEMKSFEMRPYDINDRDKFLDSYERRDKESGFFNDIDRLYSNGNLSGIAISILDNIITMMSTAEKMVNSNPLYINNTEGSRNIDSINYYSYNGISRLIDEAPELSHYKPYWDNEYSFWIERNNIMLDNIIKYKNAFPGKRIVVLCGFAHKNILKNGLTAKAPAENISVKEYWEYN